MHQVEFRDDKRTFLELTSFIDDLPFLCYVFLWKCVEMNVLPDILATDSDLDTDYDESQEEIGNMLYIL